MCDCKVGPGKFEGESALTFLAYQSGLLGCSDATTYDGDRAVDWFRAPFNFDADHQTVNEARAYGYCEPCIEAALRDESKGLSLREDSQGFVYGTTFATAAAFDRALARAEADEEANEENEGGF